MSGRNLIFIEALRTFSLLGVILFHVLAMLENRLPEEAKTSTLLLLAKLSTYYVNIAVSLFMFISGYLLKRPIDKTQILPFAKKKLVRLWLPYCAVTVLIMLTSGFFSYENILKGNFWHLWFLTALFWCFMFSIIVDYSSKYALLLLPISLVLYLVDIPPILGFYDFMRWYYFFALGALIRQYPSFINWIERYYMLVVLVIFYVIVKLYVPFSYRSPSIIHYLAESAIIFPIWLLFSRFHFYKSAKFFISIGECSMGIYVLHYWFLIYILSSTTFTIFQIPAFIATYPIWTVFVIVGVTFAMSYIATKILRIPVGGIKLIK